MKKITIEGYVFVYKGCKQWKTFTRDATKGGKVGWEKVTITFEVERNCNNCN